MNPEAAKKQLEQWRRAIPEDGSVLDPWLPAVRKLPKKLRVLALDVMGLQDDERDWARVWNARNAARDIHGPALDALAGKERCRVFEALFGPMAADIELAWQALKTAPYTGKGHRTTLFRTPSAPAGTLAMRREWLGELFDATCLFEPDGLSSAWLAAWAPYIFPDYDSREVEIGQLLAAVIDAGGPRGDEVFAILCQSARKEHEIGAMGRHVSCGLLGASRQEGWELMEKMLLAAQRQEGLRQVIFESCGAAHPEAFARILRLMGTANLTRFSSVAQAVDTWFSYLWAASAKHPLHQTVVTVADFLDDPSARQSALAGDEAEAAYLALWAEAFTDAEASLAPAARLLESDVVELRFVAALHLTFLNHEVANDLRVATLDDPDLRVALAALSGYDDSDYGITSLHGDAAFPAIERLFERTPTKTKKLASLVWPWTERETDQKSIGSFLVDAGKAEPLQLLPYLDRLDTWRRRAVARLIAAQDDWDDAARQAMLGFAGDKSADVRQIALESLGSTGIHAAEAPILEGYLTRTATDLRNGILALLQALPDVEAMAAAERLLTRKAQQPRLAGLELLRQLAAADRMRAACIATAQAFRESRKKLTKTEESQLTAIQDSDRPVLSLDDGLGLFDPAGRTPPITPREHDVPCVTQAAIELLESLDALAHEHRRTAIRYKTWSGQEREGLLGEVDYGFPQPTDQPLDSQLQNLPLADIWQAWERERPPALRDDDGQEILRAAFFRSLDGYMGDRLLEWTRAEPDRKPISALLLGGFSQPKLRYPRLIDYLLDWLPRLQDSSTPAAAAGRLAFTLDTIETLFARLPAAALAATKEHVEYRYDRVCTDFRLIRPIEHRVHLLPVMFSRYEATPAQWQRFAGLVRFFDQPCPGAQRKRQPMRVLAMLYEHDCVTPDDFGDDLIGPRYEGGWGTPFDSLKELSARRPGRIARQLLQHEGVGTFVQAVVDRVYEIEVTRGEGPTAASKAAACIGDFGGADRLLELLRGLGKTAFKTIPHWSDERGGSKAVAFTSMIRSTWPTDADTPASFEKRCRAAVGAGEFPEERLIQLAFLAPQWCALLEAALGWPGLTEAVYWYLAHMNDAEATVDGDDPPDDERGDDEDQPKRLTRWERIIRERTALTEEEREAGAIDVAWFHRTYKEIGRERWDALAKAARFAATPAQGKRAKRIGDVLLGDVPKAELVEGIEKKHLKEYVRLLGLRPLATGKKRAADLADSYEILQAYRKYANGLSSMTKPEAFLACDIGMQNLAATAGYADPMRLQWAMEAQATADLARGPVVATKGDVTLTLAIDDEARPELTVRRGDRVLKNLPKEVKKDPEFVALRDRGKHLKQQSARVQAALETAMCRGDGFSGAELMQLADHAILWPQLSRLVLIGEGILGYPEKGGKALRDHAGTLEPVRKAEAFRIAHPYDLFRSKQWSKWQKDCFAREVLQPFKQVFRELYVITAQEKKDKRISRRYAGLQVHERQARALWGRRTWSMDAYDDVFKPFPEEGISAGVVFNDGFTTPLEYEGLTIDGVCFYKRKDFEEVPLAKVPPRIFSEVMRDMDLVVSVAHTGDVDPEASASTVEMRQTLLQETCRLLRLKNVKIKDSRALIQGTLGEYTVHLGSGVVHRMPGGAVCIVPVHSQHRGRLFLPFADDDPRTAEVIAKTLLLARDDEIDDPIILEQLRAMA